MNFKKFLVLTLISLLLIPAAALAKDGHCQYRVWLYPDNPKYDYLNSVLILAKDVKFNPEKCKLTCKNGNLTYVINPIFLKKDPPVYVPWLPYEKKFRVSLGRGHYPRLVIQKVKNGEIVTSKVYLYSKQDKKYIAQD